MAVAAVTQRELPVTQILVGRQVMVAGAAVVLMKQITDNSLIFASGNDSAVTGILTITRTVGTSFTITSSVGGDVGFVAFMVVIIP